MITRFFIIWGREDWGFCDGGAPNRWARRRPLEARFFRDGRGNHYSTPFKPVLGLGRRLFPGQGTFGFSGPELHGCAQALDGGGGVLVALGPALGGARVDP